MVRDIVLDDGWQVWSEFVRRPQNAHRARRQLPDEPLAIRHLVLAVVLGQNVHAGAEALKHLTLGDVAQILNLDSIVNQALVFAVATLVRLGDVRVDLRANEHQGQFTGANAGAARVASEDLQAHLEVVQRHAGIEEGADAHFVGGILEDVVEQAQAGERRDRRLVHLDAQFVGDDVGHSLQIARRTATLIKRTQETKSWIQMLRLICIFEFYTYLRNSHQILRVHFRRTQLGDGQIEWADADARNVLRLDLHLGEESIDQIDGGVQHVAGQLVPHLQATQHMGGSVARADRYFAALQLQKQIKWGGGKG